MVQAISENAQKAESLYSRLVETSDSSERDKLIDEISKTGALYKNGALFGPNENIGFDLIQAKFKSKLNLLNSGNYVLFDRQDLFIRSNAFPFQEDVAKLFAFMISEQQTFCSKFKKVVISVPNYNLIFDLETENYEIRSFPSDDQYRIAEKARTFVIESELSTMS